MRVFVLLFFLISFSITANAINENKLDSSWYPLSTDISFGGLQYFSINGDTFNIELLDIQTTIDTIKEAIRSATVTVRISKGKKIGFADTAKNSQLSGLRNKVTIKIVCGNYTLPTTLSDFGIQIECTVVRNYLRNSNHNDWAIEKDARLRIYPYTGRFIKEGVFGFPLDAKLFSSKTQMGNEPTYVGGESLSRQKIYYHSDLDFGGVDGLGEDLSVFNEFWHEEVNGDSVPAPVDEYDDGAAAASEAAHPPLPSDRDNQHGALPRRREPTTVASRTRAAHLH